MVTLPAALVAFGCAMLLGALIFTILSMYGRRSELYTYKRYGTYTRPAMIYGFTLSAALLVGGSVGLTVYGIRHNSLVATVMAVCVGLLVGIAVRWRADGYWFKPPGPIPPTYRKLEIKLMKPEELP